MAGPEDFEPVIREKIRAVARSLQTLMMFREKFIGDVTGFGKRYAKLSEFAMVRLPKVMDTGNEFVQLSAKLLAKMDEFKAFSRSMDTYGKRFTAQDKASETFVEIMSKTYKKDDAIEFLDRMLADGEELLKDGMDFQEELDKIMEDIEEMEKEIRKYIN